MATAWVDRTRPYFVSTVGISGHGATQERLRWHEDEKGAYQKCISPPIPAVAEDYYKTAAIIDRHNRTRQDDLDIEKSFRVLDWSLRVNSTLVSICAVDAYHLFCGGRAGGGARGPNDVFSDLESPLSCCADIPMGGLVSKIKRFDIISYFLKVVAIL